MRRIVLVSGTSNPTLSKKISEFLDVPLVNPQLRRFANGEVGEEAGDEAKQLSEVVRVISEYIHAEYWRYFKYGGTEDMHRDCIITEAHIQRRLFAVAAFKGDKKTGATNAIKRAIKSLLEADEISEMAGQQMIARYGSKPRSFIATNKKRFPRPSNV